MGMGWNVSKACREIHLLDHEFWSGDFFCELMVATNMWALGYQGAFMAESG